MSQSREELAARKKLLVARSGLHRLKLQHEAHGLRRSITTPRGVLAMATAPVVRPLLFSALLRVAGRKRLSRVVQGALTALAVARAVHQLVGASRAAKSPPTPGPTGGSAP